MRKRKSFTLIELMIVVIIIGILSAVGIPQFFKAAGKAQENRAKHNLGELRTVELAYQSVMGAWSFFGATTTVNLTVDLDNDGVVDVQVSFFDPNYHYVVMGHLAVAFPIKAGLSLYWIDLDTGRTNW